MRSLRTQLGHTREGITIAREPLDGEYHDHHHYPTFFYTNNLFHDATLDLCRNGRRQLLVRCHSRMSDHEGLVKPMLHNELAFLKRFPVRTYDQCGVTVA